MTVTCTTPRCNTALFTVEGFRGTVETKCPRCKQIQTFRYTSQSPVSYDVRCSNSFKGQALGGWCGTMIARISPDTSGSFGYRCPRCKDVKTINLAQPVLVST